MGARGPAPKPTPIREIEGNPGKRAINNDEPKPRPVAPRCPQWLALEAKAEWKRIAPELERIGLLTVVDQAVLAGYCQSWAEWRASVEFLRDHTYTIVTPNGYIQQRPEVAIGQKARKDMLAFGAQLGLSPSSRGRLSVGKTDEGEEPSWLD